MHAELAEIIKTSTEISSASALVKELKLYQKWDLTPIRVKVYEDLGTVEPRFHYILSHHVHTPTQATPYYSGVNYSDTVQGAVSRALQEVTSFIDGAISLGHTFDSSWFVENEDF